jgi:hypothetical protein
MILTRYDSRLLVVLQPDHGVQTGLIAAAWGNAEVPPPREHRRAGRLAATHHDDGWAVWERRPDLDPETGVPIQFHQLKPPAHLTAYRAGIERAAQTDPWTGLLVSMHGAGLYNDRYGSFRLVEQNFTADERTLVDEFLADMASLQRQLYEQAVGHAPSRPPHELPEVRDEYLLLQIWDRLSLQYAYRHATDGVLAPLPGIGEAGLTCSSRGRFTLALEPYPFAEDRVELPVRASMIADREYADPEDFLAALAAAGQTIVDCVAVRR